MIGAYNVLLAGHARSAGLTLVTANVGEFSRVPGLNWENWQAPSGPQDRFMDTASAAARAGRTWPPRPVVPAGPQADRPRIVRRPVPPRRPGQAAERPSQSLARDRRRAGTRAGRHPEPRSGRPGRGTGRPADPTGRGTAAVGRDWAGG
jgi:hypothetical protein